MDVSQVSKRNFIIKFTLNEIFIVIGFIVIIVFDLFGINRSSITLGYADEVFCAICFLLLSIYSMWHKRLHSFSFYFIILVLLGILGNLISGVQRNLAVAITDAFIFLKPYIVMIYIMTTIRKEQAQRLYSSISLLSKFFLIILFLSSIISSYKANMQDYEGNFEFLSGFTGTVSMWTILLLSVIVSEKKNNRFFYYLLSAIVIFRTDSGLGKLAIIGLIGIYIFFEKRKRFKWYYLIIIIPVCLWVGRNEITGYLMNRNAPRFLLFYYSIVTAIRFLPLGAGFATFGSAMANKVYSPLYLEYGFNEMYGMSLTKRLYLMDSYFPQIIGQLGFIGTIVFVAFLLSLFRKIIWKEQNIFIRNASLYLLVIWGSAGLGFGTTSSSWGCSVFFVLSLFYLIDRSMSESKGRR